MNPSCDIIIDVPFHDVDMLGVVWHGHYYKYFELARTALFRKYNFDVPQIKALGYSMVVIDSSCRYIVPLKYGKQAHVRAELVETENRLVIKYVIRDPETNKKMARGSTTQVTLNAANGELFMVTPAAVKAPFAVEADASRQDSKVGEVS